MRFANYGALTARRAKRAPMKGYGWADSQQDVPRGIFGRFGDGSDGCASGYSADANGNCVDASGAGQGCNGGKVDANGNCLNSDGTAQGCGPGTTVTATGTCLDSSGNPISASAPSAASAPAASSGTSVWSDIGSAIGSAGKALTGGTAKPTVVSSGSSFLIPGLFVAGALGVVVFVVAKKKKK